MTAFTPIRITTVLGTVALLAAALATIASADIGDGRSPDTKDTAASSSELDPAIAAAIVSHRRQVTAADKRSPDTKDTAGRSGELDPAIAAVIASHRTSVTAADKRSPDTREATRVTAAPATIPQASVVASDSAFNWTDAAIGAFAGFAIALLLSGMILLSHRDRQRSLAV